MPGYRYEIRVASALDLKWSSWFDDAELRAEQGTTVITVTLADQPALHGLLTRIRDLGLEIDALRRLDPGQTSGEDDL